MTQTMSVTLNFVPVDVTHVARLLYGEHFRDYILKVMEASRISNGESCVPSISTILFDLDNTLIFTREADTATCITVASWLESQGLSKEESLEITTCFLQKFREAPAPDYPTDVAGLDNWRVDIWASVLPEILHQHTEDVYSLWKQERLNQLSLKPAVINMLQELATEFNLGLITNGPSVAQWEKINESGCHKFFNTIIVSGDLDVEKPDKYVYELACSELKLEESLSTDTLLKLGAIIAPEATQRRL